MVCKGVEGDNGEGREGDATFLGRVGGERVAIDFLRGLFLFEVGFPAMSVRKKKESQSNETHTS